MKELLDGIHGLALGASIPPDVNYVLSRAGLTEEGSLTDGGQRIYKQAWVLRNKATSMSLLGEALRPLLPVQVIDQELRGFGSVPEEGVLDLLRVHRAVPDELSLEDCRRFLRWGSDLNLFKYSRRDKSVRAVPSAASAPKLGEDRRLAAPISPRTPFTNVIRLRRILRTLEGRVWWLDPHFGRRALEEVAEELDPAQVKEFFVLSGTDSGVVSEKARKDFERLKQELGSKGVTAEWRTDQERDWHDRFLIDDEGGYNIPPVNTLFKGDYSEILPYTTRPPVEEWWARSIGW